MCTCMCAATLSLMYFKSMNRQNSRLIQLEICLGCTTSYEVTKVHKLMLGESEFQCGEVYEF